jgi:hypothetical protein
MPSISAAAVGNGEIVWQEALGFADVDNEAAAVPDTQYRVGSITKTFTAVAILQLRAPSSVFTPESTGRFRGVSGPEEGELLEVVRSDDGTVEKLYWATYPMTRTPQPFSR